MGNIVPVFQTPGATSKWLAALQPQMKLALPKHMSVERMTRLVLTVFSQNPKLAECSPFSVAASIMTASQLGLEPNVNGQGYLIPYGGACTFVPGWKGLVDLANRGGRCTVWTGAVYKGDDFDYQLGDNPFVRHKPGDGDENPDDLLYVYAIGRIKGQEVPVVEVWSRAKVDRHLKKWNKLGAKHYALANNRANFEMYGRKVPLLQVLKYMPQSIELTAAMAASHAAEEGRTINIDGATWVTTENPDENHPDGGAQGDESAGQPKGNGPSGQSGNGGAAAKPPLSDADLKKKEGTLRAALKNGAVVNDLIAALETKNSLSGDQMMEIAGWAKEEQSTTEGASQ